MTRDTTYHVPILVPEVLEGLNVHPGGKYIDTTLGGGGHTEEILKKGGIVLGIDRDEDAIEYTKVYLKEWIDNKKLELERGNFENVKEIAENAGFTEVDGVLFDLGISSHQLDKSGRGFTFRRDEPLDMRMDQREKLDAKQIIQTYSKGELYDIFSTYAEEIDSRNVSESIVNARSVKKIETTNDLIKSLGIDVNDTNKKTVTRIFQALRIEVNRELENLKKAIPQALELVKKEGRMVFISFHSLEDRAVKLTMRKYNVRKIAGKPITSTREERSKNSRARSAKLRIYEKI